MVVVFFFQAEDGIRDLVRSRGLGDVYKRQRRGLRALAQPGQPAAGAGAQPAAHHQRPRGLPEPCLLYTSDAADERSSVDLGGRRIIKKKKLLITTGNVPNNYKHKNRRNELNIKSIRPRRKT